MIDNNDFVEYNSYNDNYYGTSLNELIKSKNNNTVIFKRLTN